MLLFTFDWEIKMHHWKKALLTSGILAAGLAVPSLAKAEEPASPHTLTANVGLYSQYVFRGLTQTDEEPALQGGFDYAHKSGLYLGVWGSNVSWLSDDSTGFYEDGGSLELDIYGGLRGAIGKSDFTYDVGALYYWYPGDTRSGIGAAGLTDADTLEIYGGLGWKWFSAKYSYSVSDTFGIEDADGTWYLDLSAAVPLGETGLTLGLHYGMQEYEIDGDLDEDDASYDDWKVSLTYDLGRLTPMLNATTFGVAYTDNNADEDFYLGHMADSQFVVWVQRVF
jgi:uncharacterized protein (TIGR02001 family)